MRPTLLYFSLYSRFSIPQTREQHLSIPTSHVTFDPDISCYFLSLVPPPHRIENLRASEDAQLVSTQEGGG